MAVSTAITQTLPVMEHFYTIQGEGAYSGVPAYFIRLGGCDVGCVWCDVKESWDADKHPKFSIKEITSWVAKTKAKVVVVTGGEPLMYNLDALTESLQKLGVRKHIETSGAHPFTGNWDWVTFSPKKFKAPLPEIYSKANELKIIIFNKHDFKWAEEFEKLVNPLCSLYLQTEWDKSKQMTPQIISYVKANPQWRISLQTHKYMSIP
jgi:organic radical activating enzyme